MADEKTPDETTEGLDAQSTGPVEGADSSSSQAAGEELTPTPPVEDAAEEPTDETAAEPEASADESAPAEEEPSEEVAAESEEEPSEEVVVEAVAVEETPGGEVLAEVEVEIEVDEEPEPAERKKDVIPGADLEPIKVDADPELSAEERARLEAEEEEKARREAALVGSDDPDAAAAGRAPAKMASDARFLATGKRKCSIARVTVLPGDGKIEINKRSIEEFFPRPLHQTLAVQPLAVSGYEGNVDVRVRVHGGGISGQAGAVRHGIARALIEIDPELRGDLKRRGFLTRDARVKERRKAGFKKARKKPQFSKR
jgi:small subunit ribosomal protein S9